MSVTRTTPVQTEPTSHTKAARVTASVAALVLASALFWTVAAVNVPHDPSDAELLTWWQDSGNRTSGLFSGLCAIVVACSIAIVMNYLHTLTAAARAPHWLAFARSMGAAVTAVWLVTGAVRASIGHLVDAMSEPLPGVDALRLVTAINYTLLGLCGMAVLSLCILAVSVVVLRTAALSRWVAFVGLGCAVVMLVATIAQYGAFTTPLGILWALCLAVALWRHPA